VGASSSEEELMGSTQETGAVRGNPLLTAAIGIVLGLSLVAAQSFRAHGTPGRTVSGLVSALADGDLDDLVGEEPFHFAGVVESEIAVRGDAEYRRILDIYETQRYLGVSEFNRLRGQYNSILDQAANAGITAFNNLSEDARWQVWVGMSKREWLYQVALPEVDADRRQNLPSLEVLDDPDLRATFEMDLGCADAGSDAVAILAQVRAGSLDPTDRTISRILGRCADEGASMVRRAVRSLDRRMDRHDPGRGRRPAASDAPQAQSRERVRQQELGWSALTATQRDFVEQNRDMLEAYDAEPYYWSLGWQQLSPEQRAELGDTSHADFVAARDEFVSREGRRLYTEFITGAFGGCSASLENRHRMGPPGGSLLRGWRLEARLELHASDDERSIWHEGERVGIELTAEVPAEHLRVGWQADPVTWQQALDGNLLVDDFTFASADCEGYLDERAILWFERGRWHLGWLGAPGVPNFDPRPERREVR